MATTAPRDELFALEQIGIKLGLDQIRGLIAALDHPDRAFPSIVIAGTNGKGSVTAFVERALRAAGYRTGRYTSPHLVNIEERIAIDGIDISAAAFDESLRIVMAASRSLASPPTFFEVTTAVALLDAFRAAKVDIAVLEVGLGGRLDATNAVSPIGVAITAIDFDHEQYLGHTLDAIAREKAGVIKPGIVAVLGRNPAVVQELVESTCRAQTEPAEYVYAPCVVAHDMDVALEDGRARLRALGTATRRIGDVTLGLRGRHQIDNAIAATALLDAIDRRSALTITDAAMRAGLEDATWPARLELRQWQGRNILIDGAHNPAGARSLAAYIAESYSSRLPIVIGAMHDKDAAGIMRELASVASTWICTAPSTPRALAASALGALARDVTPDIPTIIAASAAEARDRVQMMTGTIVVAGSLYLAGEMRALLA